MGSTQTATLTPATTETPLVLIRRRGEGVLELHFVDPLTAPDRNHASNLTHDYRLKPAEEITQANVAIAYRLFWRLSDLPGLEIAVADYRKVTLTFGQVFLNDSTKWEEVRAALETAIKRYLGHEVVRFIWR